MLDTTLNKYVLSEIGEDDIHDLTYSGVPNQGDTLTWEPGDICCDVIMRDVLLVVGHISDSHWQREERTFTSNCQVLCQHSSSYFI